MPTGFGGLLACRNTQANMTVAESRMASREGTAAERIAAVLPALYAAASAPGRWPEAFAGIVDFLGGDSGLMFSHQATPELHGLWVPHKLQPVWLQRYAEHYHAHDIWMQAGEARCVFVPGNVITGDDLLPRRAFLDSLFYREFLRPQDIHDVCGGMLHDGSEPGIPRIHVAVYRSLSRPVFGEADKEVMRSLVPHLRETTRIAFRLAEMEQRLSVMEAAADTIAPALVLADDAGRIVFANRPAQHLLEARDGLWLESGRLLAAAPAQRIALEKMVRSHSPLESMMRISRPSGKPGYWVMRMALPAVREQPEDARRPSAALMIHDPSTSENLNVGDFAATHELSRAESRLLVALLTHSTLPQAAAHLDVSVNTVRTQLRGILDKTGARRQVELIRMLMAWPRKRT